MFFFIITFILVVQETPRAFVGILGQLYRTDRTIGRSFDCGPEGLDVITRKHPKFENGVISLEFVDCLVATVHTCFVCEPKCEVVEVCMDHESTTCEECPRETNWKLKTQHCDRDSYYVLDAAHGYNPSFK